MKILLYMPNYIGDVLMTTPAIRVLKTKLPQAKIYAVIRPHLVELLESNPNIDVIICKEARNKLLKDVVYIKPDYVILFRTTFFSSLMSAVAGCKFSVGINEELSKLFLSSTIRKDITRPYRYECLLLVQKFLQHISLPYNDISTDELKKIDFYGWDNEKIKFSVEEKFKKHGINLTKNIIVFSLCSSRKTKMLTPQQYVKLIDMTNTIYNNLQVILVGSKNDIKFIMEILKNQRFNNVISLCGETSLKELAYIISLSKILFSVDSGTAYIGESVGTKTVVLFTSTLPEKYGPYPENVNIVYQPVICSPCYKNECRRKDYKCITSVELTEVIQQIRI